MSIVIDNKILIVLFRIFFFNTNYLLVKLFQHISFFLKESIHIKLSAKRQCAVMGAGEDALGEVFCSPVPFFLFLFRSEASHMALGPEVKTCSAAKRYD